MVSALRCVLFRDLTPPSATGFSQSFPGIKPHLLTLETNFRTPFYRDILMWLGVCSVSKESCQNILGQGGGSAITIVVGGAAESLSAHPGTADLTLRKRHESCRSNNLPRSYDPFHQARIHQGRHSGGVCRGDGKYRTHKVNIVIGPIWFLYSRSERTT